LKHWKVRPRQAAAVPARRGCYTRLPCSNLDSFLPSFLRPFLPYLPSPGSLHFPSGVVARRRRMHREGALAEPDLVQSSILPMILCPPLNSSTPCPRCQCSDAAVLQCANVPMPSGAICLPFVVFPLPQPSTTYEDAPPSTTAQSPHQQPPRRCSPLHFRPHQRRLHRLTGQWPVRSVQKVHAALRCVALRCVALSCRVHLWTKPSPNKLLRPRPRPRVAPYYRSLRLRCRRPSRRSRPSRVGLQKRAASRARASSAYHLGMVLSLWAI
jgi:hypothetical protein